MGQERKLVWLDSFDAQTLDCLMIGSLKQPTTYREADMSQTQGILLAFLLVICVGTEPVAAEKKYDPGASDNEIKVGNIMPYSGPLSAYALIGRTEAAFFNKINAEGGINGRKINFITYDDAFSPPKTVEQARKLVESDEMLLIFQSLGTPTNNAIRPYMNQKKATAVRRYRCHSLRRLDELSMDHGLAADLSDRGAYLCKIHPAEPAAGQDRHSTTRTTIRVATTSRASKTALVPTPQSA
jgi:Periplasmic binding protein